MTEPSGIQQGLSALQQTIMSSSSSDSGTNTAQYLCSERENDQEPHANTPQKPEHVEIHPLQSNHESSIDPETTTSQQTSRLWKPFVLRWGPISGLVAMLVATASILASLGILLGSRQTPVESWTLQPSVYLGVFTAVANQAMRYAAFQGVIIAWWTAALRGSTLKRLHTDWRACTTFLGAVGAGRNTGLIGIACIFSTFVPIDGPFLQRASSVVSEPIQGVSVPLNVSLAPEIPSYYTGLWGQSLTNWARWNPAFNRTMPSGRGEASNLIYSQTNNGMDFHIAPHYFGDAPMTGVVHGCPGRCTAKIRAPALAVEACTTHLHHMDYYTPWAWNGSWAMAFPYFTKGFLIKFNLNLRDGIEKLDVVTGYADVNDKCDGVLNLTACTFQSGIGEYSVTIVNDTIVWDEDTGWPIIVAIANNTQLYPSGSLNSTQALWHPSTLAGLVRTALAQWDSDSVQWFDTNTQAPQVSDYRQDISRRYARPVSGDACLAYRDPRDDVLRSLNKLMVYAGIHAASHADHWGGANSTKSMDAGLAVRTTVTGSREGNENVYAASLKWWVAAAIVETVCIALILPTYMGWWKLGRPVSFSPLEIAKAFEAPLLTDYHSNSTGYDTAKSNGNLNVQYGVVPIDTKAGKVKLAFDREDSVDRPWRGAAFDD